jgi:RNA polymerase sigma-70 factor, ECF subfamily
VFREEILPELDSVYRFALRLTRDPDPARDLTQETFLRAFENRERYQPGTRARSWLFTMARNLFLRRERRGRRHEEIVRELVKDGEERPGQESAAFQTALGDDPEGAFWDSIVDDEVLREIEALPEEFREVVFLSDLEGLSYAEVAAILEVPVGTVKSRLFRARRILQGRLHSYAVEAGILPAGRDAE